MASTYQSAWVSSGAPARTGVGLQCSYASYEAAVQLVINDVIQMVPIAKGQTVVDAIVSLDDLDGGSAAVITLGDGADTDRFASSTLGQGGGTFRLGDGLTGAAAADALNYEYAADDTIDLKVATAPASTGTGTVKVAIFHTSQQ